MVAIRGVKIAFGTLWRQFGVRHGAILAGWAGLESRIFFTPGRNFSAPGTPSAGPARASPSQLEPARRTSAQDWAGRQFPSFSFENLAFPCIQRADASNGRLLQF